MCLCMPDYKSLCAAALIAVADLIINKKLDPTAYKIAIHTIRVR